MKFKLFPLVFLFLLTSCVKEKIEVKDISSSISPEFGVPLAKATIFAEKVIERYDDQGLVTTDEEGVLTLIYQDTLESISADEFLGLEDQQIADEYELNASDLSNLASFGTLLFEQDVIYNLEFGDDRLDSIRFETGVLTLLVNSDGSIPLTGMMSILDPFTGESLFSTSF
ncbi:MAG: hypothetical protein ACJAY4_001429, partial [Cryomorphaceae bacterium]